MDNEMTGIEKLRKYAEGLSMTAGFRFAQEYGRDLFEMYKQIWREQADDRKIAEWVREQGGIGILELHEEAFKELKCERDRYKACARLLDKVYSIINPDESDERPFEKGDTVISSFKKIREELNKRLMPSGMEWMKIEGEPMDTTAIYEVDGEPVKIWSIGYYGNKDVQEVEVEYIDGSGNIDSVDPREINRPKQYPICYDIGADGLPINDGETVYGIGSKHEFKVIDTKNNVPYFGERFSIKCFDKDNNEVCWCDPKMLTHTKPEPPDSYEKLWQDMFPNNSDEAVGLNRDEFVRRAKALAERDRNK